MAIKNLWKYGDLSRTFEAEPLIKIYWEPEKKTKVCGSHSNNMVSLEHRKKTTVLLPSKAIPNRVAVDRQPIIDTVESNDCSGFLKYGRIFLVV